MVALVIDPPIVSPVRPPTLLPAPLVERVASASQLLTVQFFICPAILPTNAFSLVVVTDPSNRIVLIVVASVKPATPPTCSVPSTSPFTVQFSMIPLALRPMRIPV